MSRQAFKLLLIIMRRAFSRQHLLAKDPNWTWRTDLTIQQGGWVPCLQGTSAAAITAAVRKECCLALLCCLPQHLTQSELGARTSAYPSPFLRWHDVIKAVPRDQNAVLYLITLKNVDRVPTPCDCDFFSVGVFERWCTTHSQSLARRGWQTEQPVRRFILDNTLSTTPAG